MLDISDTERRLIEFAPTYQIFGGRSDNFSAQNLVFSNKDSIFAPKISILCNHTEIFYLILYHRQRW